MKLLIAFAAAFIAAVHSEDSQLVHNFISGNYRFAADVYKQLTKHKSGENFLFCPLSAEIILALTQFGAKGQTAQQLSRGLHLPEDKHELENIFKQIIPSLRGNEKYTLSSANKIYIKNGFEIRHDFRNVAENTFGAEIQTINFKNKKSAAQEMNTWVEAKTDHKIENFVDPDILNEDTRAMLINALYFNGTWITAFTKRYTHKKKFFLNHHNHVNVDMMEVTDFYQYYECPELKAKFLEMPYEGDNFSMVVILPNDREGLLALENKIDQVMNTVIRQELKVHVQIPKFKRETEIRLTDLLKDLGIKDAFEDYADFSGFGTPGQFPIKISDVVQKSVIEVDEEGTTAAAATAVHQVLLISGSFADPKQFIADHPFIYYIKSPAGIMFIGRYVN